MFQLACVHATLRNFANLIPKNLWTHRPPSISKRSEVTAPQPLTTFGIRHQHDVILSSLEAVSCLHVLQGAHDGGVQHPVVFVHFLLVADFRGFGEQVLHPIGGIHSAWTTAAAAAGESLAEGGERKRAKQ